ncbi:MULTISPECIES: hypothetical protein [unclassified Modestobacter]|uniref:hypothetical protein n=1 Tax=unclassified Modestobacter TaxID=2643866 RepID=UPI0022AA5D1B|nr:MULTISPECIES: hypothetical protein [unclassified Modestobacter]MCZ2823876.1 hypothetical protein [Modestobacter sp. VKM Ac-2981]MCZ2852121.1 hypothetical protein [Modestobacter sp. VKM Ac-2982]
MNSTDITTAGVRTVTSPAVGLRCSTPAEWVVSMATAAAPHRGTGLPFAGSATAVRLRGLTAAAGTTGLSTTGARLGADALPSVQTTSVQNTALKGYAVIGAPARHTSSTPGDLPPEDPLG